MTNVTGKDFLVAAIVGELVAWLFILISHNLQLAILDTFLNLLKNRLLLFGSLPILFPILSVIGFGAAYLVSKKIPVVLQAAKFILVGALNTFVDLGVLNLLIFVSGIAAGIHFSIFKGVSFTVAVINSYLWNKFWTFKKATQDNLKVEQTKTEFFQFFAISVGGLLINVGVASLIVNFVGAPEFIDPKTWANVGAILATLASLIWNFLGYKFIVFKT